ncbi:MAG: rhodanese-like domain-containing protein [Bacteroidia bacterium]|nr:rhodanese-like domain-containing protein [Bacteroidia bacterium]
MKVIYTIILGAMLVTACGNKKATTNTETATTQTTIEATPSDVEFKVLSAADFNNAITNNPGIILDVRTPGEFKKGYIKDARLLDIFSDEFDTELNKLDRNATYYVYCASGGRSAECTEKMQGLGFKKVYDLDNGMGAWLNAGLPVQMP